MQKSPRNFQQQENDNNFTQQAAQMMASAQIIQSPREEVRAQMYRNRISDQSDLSPKVELSNLVNRVRKGSKAKLSGV